MGVAGPREGPEVVVTVGFGDNNMICILLILRGV